MVDPRQPSCLRARQRQSMAVASGFDLRPPVRAARSRRHRASGPTLHVVMESTAGAVQLRLADQRQERLEMLWNKVLSILYIHT